eukprot:3938574-Rhodomonas_salina.1
MQTGADTPQGQRPSDVGNLTASTMAAPTQTTRRQWKHARRFAEDDGGLFHHRDTVPGSSTKDTIRPSLLLFLPICPPLLAPPL